eukprot:COSAG01_NODE_16565_length_1225_cov_2.064831_2_plen_72_part_01
MAPPPQPQRQRCRRLLPLWLAHARSRSLLGGARRALLAGVLYYYEESTDEEPINWIQLDAKTEIKVHPEDFM